MKMENLNTENVCDYLVEEFKNSNESLMSDIGNLIFMVIENAQHVGIEDVVNAAIALHSFDLENIDSEYSEDLKLSIATQKPLMFTERVSELCLIISAIKRIPAIWVITSTLALHKNRIVNDDFRSLPNSIKDKSN